MPMRAAAGGTAWQPDATPEAALHGFAGPWMLMVHGSAALALVRESSERGGWLLGSMNWVMADAARSAAGGRLGLVLGGSAEALTLGRCGYPELLAVGPTCSHNLFGDFQHAHAPVMELAARYEHLLVAGTSAFLYGGPVGEPALGPPSYLHRLSAFADPVAPITSHETNPGHSSAGVVTAGIGGRSWQLEGSAFDATTADPARVLPSHYALNSASARLSVNPAPWLSLQVSGGRIGPAPGHHAGATGPLRSYTTSASWHRLGASGSVFATTLALARLQDDAGPRDVALLETSIAPSERHTVFARAEIARRQQAQITILEQPDGSHVHLVSATPYGVAELAGGYAFGVRLGGELVGAGARASLSFLSPVIAPDYGRRRAAGLAAFLSLRPAPAR